MKHILLPTDFSENAQAAANFVCSSFNPQSVKLYLMHSVVPPRSTPGMMINISTLIQNDAEKDIELERQRLLDHFGNEWSIETGVKQGYLQDTIPSFCRGLSIDLIAMGTQGENSLSSKVFGSNTENIIRRGYAPVLAIPENYEVQKEVVVNIATEHEHVPQESVLLSMLEALQHTTQLRMKVLRVVDGESGKSPKSIEVGGLQVPVEVEIASNVEEGISHYLENHGGDILVLYHEHNSRLDYLFSRSTTKKLAGKIQVPMIILPS
ncbi:MAG: universal stress protein [Bacteroidia bacterium]|nr:universal stress protein [Bacteroidia bacterium]